ncbi:hypothetical protein [Salinicola rhizosphaerae]|uniref:Uncharacterized protein n=1 Tax=Salinicola rhizosphaerae TaxID=1443141 RepID=A0ABQ3EAP5_9GAMM|nr:hypothetical protein [Salinicola rhizosphaerae]GHB30384.1 hypothetical protein GCM10009038_31450 [Salinicola rhizosphaerae]
MKLIIEPQESSLTASYSASGNILTVSMGGVSDTFDFGTEDGVFTEFESPELPVCPVQRAAMADGVVTAAVIGFYTPTPPEKADDETDQDFKVRIDEWTASKQVREVDI